MRSLIIQRALGGAVPLVVLAAALDAQTPRAPSRDRDDRRARVFSLDQWDDADRPRLGISTGSGGMRDTLGLLVVGVTAGGPADRAGIQEGDRIASIDGVNLRISKEDAEEGDMDGVALRRLTRELRKKKVGDEVELRLFSDGRARSVRVRTVGADSLRELARDRLRSRVDRDERAALGLSLGSTGSRRDTLGLMVLRVTPDGPAEKAGIAEGDRIAAINGVDLRTPREDVEDEGWFGGARTGRLERELRKLDPGKDAELRVYSGREARTVRVRPVKASELSRSERGRRGFYMFDDGSLGDLPIPPLPPIAPRPLRIGPIGPRVFELDAGLRGLRDLDTMGLDGGMRIRIHPRVHRDVEARVREAMARAFEMSER